MFHLLVMSRDRPLHILSVRGRIKGIRWVQTDEPDLSDSTWPARYEIRVEEALDGRWSAWFDGLEVRRGAGETIISGSLLDEAALHGVLAKIRDLGLGLIGVCRVGPG
jgi:hypothetical protein